MKPLFITLFCPNDCELLSEGEKILEFDSSICWRIKKLKIGDPVPSWGTHGWFLFRKGGNIEVENAHLTIDEWLVAAKIYWENDDYPGWELNDEPPGIKGEASHTIIMGRL